MSYKEILDSMRTGNRPRIVERSSLPPDLQKKNSLISVAGNLIYQVDLDQMKKQPKVGKVLTLAELGDHINQGNSLNLFDFPENGDGKKWDNALEDQQNFKKLGDKTHLNPEKRQKADVQN